jgi:hypothetical protein
MTILHTVPRYDGEDAMEHPATTDLRFIGFMRVLKTHGLVDDGGMALIPHHIMRGCGPDGYLYRVEWDNSANKKATESQPGAGPQPE